MIKKTNVRVKLLFMVVPLAVLSMAVVLIMNSLMLEIYNKEKAVLSDKINAGSQLILNADRDFHQALLAMNYIAEGVQPGEGQDYIADYKDNLTQTIERIDAGVKTFQLEEEDASLSPKTLFLAIQEQDKSLEDTEGYLDESRTLEQMRQDFMSQMEEWKKIYNPETNEGDVTEAITVFETVRSNIDGMTLFTELYTTYSLTRMKTEMYTFNNILIVGTFLLIIAIFAFSLYISHYFKTSIQRAMVGVETLSGNDLVTVPNVVEGNDEICELTRATKGLFDNLQAVIGKINDVTGDLHSAAGELHDGAKEVSSATSQIVDAVNQTAETITDQANDTEKAAVQIHGLEEIVEKNTQSADTLAEASKSIQTATSAGMDVVNELEKATEESNLAFENIFGVIEAMNSSVGKIGEASSLISGIAEQTNLLSLNASIEAARAGEAGKGFSVVADEIRQLADQSSSAANTIDDMLEELRNKSEKVDKESNIVRDIVQAQSRSVGETKEHYVAIVDTIGNIDHEIHELDTISESMGESCRNVVDLISNLSASAEENAATTQETSASAEYIRKSIQVIADASEHVNDLSISLKEVLQQFRF